MDGADPSVLTAENSLPGKPLNGFPGIVPAYVPQQLSISCCGCLLRYLRPFCGELVGPIRGLPVPGFRLC
jgi:hypothetical protein